MLHTCSMLNPFLGLIRYYQGPGDPSEAGHDALFLRSVSQSCLCYLAATDAERQNIKCIFQNRDNSPEPANHWLDISCNQPSLCKEQLEASTVRSERRNVHQLGLVQSQEAVHALPGQLEVAR